MSSIYCDHIWKIYWEVGRSGEERDDQVVTIDGNFATLSFTYYEISNEREECLEIIWDTFEAITVRDIKEIEFYIDDFLDEVELNFD